MNSFPLWAKGFSETGPPCSLQPVSLMASCPWTWMPASCSQIPLTSSAQRRSSCWRWELRRARTSWRKMTWLWQMWSCRKPRWRSSHRCVPTLLLQCGFCAWVLEPFLSVTLWVVVILKSLPLATAPSVGLSVCHGVSDLLSELN